MADRAHLLSDEDLLRALAASFPVEPVEPDPALLHQLSLAVAELRQKAPRRRRPTRRAAGCAGPCRAGSVRSCLAAAAIGVVGAGTGISYAVGVPIPAAVRSIVRSVGLAHTAPRRRTPPRAAAAATAARQAESTLHQALTESHPPLSVISHDSTVLAHRLARVGGPCRRRGSGDDGGRAASLERGVPAAGRVRTRHRRLGLRRRWRERGHIPGLRARRRSGTPRRDRRRARSSTFPPPPPARRKCRSPRNPAGAGSEAPVGGSAEDPPARNPDGRDDGDHDAGTSPGHSPGGSSDEADPAGSSASSSGSQTRTRRAYATTADDDVSPVRRPLRLTDRRPGRRPGIREADYRSARCVRPPPGRCVRKRSGVRNQSAPATISLAPTSAH